MDDILGEGEGPGAALGRRILVVDDHPVNLKLIQHVLVKAGYIAHMAASAKEAIDLFRNAEFDLVLMDICMPEMDGYSAAANMREIEKGTGKRVPIVAVTALLHEETMKQACEAGMDDFLPKPVATRSLIEIIEKWIQ